MSHPVHSVCAPWSSSECLPLMATAWLGHLKFGNGIGFWMALGASWPLMLPEYVLNQPRSPERETRARP
ncbi:MAG TPA: DMT family protein [Acidobacteriaceae bacterium]